MATSWTPQPVPISTWGPENDGDVDGPASSTDNAIARFNGTTGKIIQDSGVLIDDSNNMTGVAQITATTFNDGTATLTGGVLASSGTLGLTGSTQIDINSVANVLADMTWGGGIKAQFGDTNSYVKSDASGELQVYGSTSVTIGANAIMSGNITMPEDGWIGIGAAAERIVFDGTGGLLTVTAANLRLDDTNKTEYRDADISISSQSDGFLDVDADTRINLNANVGMLDGNWIGINSTNPRIEFDSTDGELRVRSARFGIGTNAIPHGGIGAAKLAIDGANASTAGPHIQLTTASDDYPVMQFLPWAHDVIGQAFDAYYDGATWRSSDAGSNYRIFKNADFLKFDADGAVAAGSAITWVTAFQIEADAEVLFSPNAARKLYFRDADISISSQDDSFLDLIADGAVRSNKLYVYNSGTHSGSNYMLLEHNQVNGKITVGTGRIQFVSDTLRADNAKSVFGSGADVEFFYDGADMKVVTDAVAASDFIVDCGTAKTLELAEAVWKDENLDSGRVQLPASSAPSIDTFTDEAGADTDIACLAFSDGDKIGGTFEIQHDYKNGSDFTFHIHFQCDAAPSGTDYVAWEIDYTVVRDGATMDAVTNISTGDITVDTQYEQLRGNWTAVTGTAFQIGDQISFKLARVTATGDAYAGDCKLKTVGIHYQVDTIGSRQIGAK